ncbi:hypothetical protein MKW98_004884 [Papaver atlanticum]|uniref:Prolamin-like domain-containing protein n=1 Tax=Papaver atlanticum TaxID=357466 RepID=A0AAD4RWY8_9MAGN|nr:hypothetical protein MKW98_004884 [Papaver atlanticum]
MANITTVIATRDLTTVSRSLVGHNLAARINGEDGAGMADSLKALYELRSCTNENYVSFEIYLSIEYCRAIRIITRECWSSMLTSVGFTAEEGDILRGYCNATHSNAYRSSPVAMLPPVQIIPVGTKYRTLI